jgi:DNA-binding beta-propeller fold protein YncE
VFIFVAALAGLATTSTFSNAYGNYRYYAQWGSYGQKSGEFSQPFGLAVDSIRADLYVADTYNHRVQVFHISNPCPQHTREITPGVCFVTMWGSYGTGNGEFKYPQGIGVDALGNIFVADTVNNRIQMFTQEDPCTSGGLVVAKKICFIVSWQGIDSLDHPRGITVDLKGNIFVADAANNRIQQFLLRNNCDSGTEVATGVCYVKKWGSYGSNEGEFKIPWDIAIDPISGNIFVAEINNDRIQQFQLHKNCGSNTEVVPGVCYINQWGSNGNGFGQFDNPYGVALDSKGRIFVDDRTNERIQVFQLMEKCPANTEVIVGVCLIDEWGSSGVGDGQFKLPHGIDVATLLEQGIVFVADTINHRIQVFGDETRPSSFSFVPK